MLVLTIKNTMQNDSPTSQNLWWNAIQKIQAESLKDEFFASKALLVDAEPFLDSDANPSWFSLWAGKGNPMRLLPCVNLLLHLHAGSCSSCELVEASLQLLVLWCAAGLQCPWQHGINHHLLATSSNVVLKILHSKQGEMPKTEVRDYSWREK